MIEPNCSTPDQSHPYKKPCGCSYRSIYEVPPEQRTEEMYLHAISENPHRIRSVPPEQRSQKLIDLALKGSGATLQYLPVEERTKQRCLDAIEQNPWAIRYTPTHFLDLETYLRALIQEPLIFESVPEEIRFHPVFLLTALLRRRGVADQIPDRVLLNFLTMLKKHYGPVETLPRLAE